jgi:hypothetical protein
MEDEPHKQITKSTEQLVIQTQQNQQQQQTSFNHYETDLKNQQQQQTSFNHYETDIKPQKNEIEKTAVATATDSKKREDNNAHKPHTQKTLCGCCSLS